MDEKNMKNYSIRLGSEEVWRLKVLAHTNYYWGMSGIIRGIIIAVFKALSDIQIYDLVRFGYGASGIEVKITINKK